MENVIWIFPHTAISLRCVFIQANRNTQRNGRLLILNENVNQKEHANISLNVDSCAYKSKTWVTAEENK